MNRRLIFTIAALFIYTLLPAQNTCNCGENLLKMIQKTEENYAGFPVKVNAKSQKKYNTLINALKQQAAPETNTKRCYYIIKQYVGFFNDKHFILSYYDEKDFDSTVVQLSQTELKRGTSNKTPAPVEGIWMSPDSATTIAIRKNATGLFQAVRLKSTKDNFPAGFVYFTLTPSQDQFIVKSYNAFVSTATPAKQRGNLLQIWNQAIWGKVYPQQMNKEEAAELATWNNNNKGLAFRKLNTDVTYLKVPSFFNNDNAIQQLVSRNDSLIRSTKYLVVDLTGNGGGNTGWVQFLPYFMTNPIVQPPALVRVTPDNLAMKLPELKYFVTNPVSEEYRKYFPDSILNKYKQAYAELPVTKEKFYPIPAVTFPMDSVTKYPQKIALIVDNFCGSSTEYFFYLSKQSRKTISYGINTIGMMDYEGMSTPTPLPCKNLILTIPIAKSGWTDRNPIDATGFKPDVMLNMPQNKWLDYIVNDLPKR